MTTIRKYCFFAVLAILVAGCSDRSHTKRSARDWKMLSQLTDAVSEGQYTQVVSLADTLLSLPDDSISAEVRKATRGCKALAYIMSNNLDSAANYILDLEDMVETDTGTFYNI